MEPDPPLPQMMSRRPASKVSNRSDTTCSICDDQKEVSGRTYRYPVDVVDQKLHRLFLVVVHEEKHFVSHCVEQVVLPDQLEDVPPLQPQIYVQGFVVLFVVGVPTV